MKTGPSFEDSINKSLSEVGSNPLHGITVGSGELGDLLKGDICIFKASGGNMVCTSEQQEDQIQTAVLGFEFFKPRVW